MDKTILKIKKPANAEKLMEYYSKMHCYNLKDCLNKTNKQKIVIFTFSDVIELIKEYEDNSVYKQMIVSEYKSQKKFIDDYVNCYKDNKVEIIFIKFRPCDCEHLNHIKFLIEHIEREIHIDESKSNKKVVFIIYLSRFLLSQKKSKEEILRDTLKTENGKREIYNGICA